MAGQIFKKEKWPKRLEEPQQKAKQITNDWELQKWWLTSNIKVHYLWKCKGSYLALSLATTFDASYGWELDVLLLGFPCCFFHLLIAEAGARGHVAVLIPLKEAIFVLHVLLITAWLSREWPPRWFVSLGALCLWPVLRNQLGSAGSWEWVIPGCVLAFQCSGCMWSVWHPNATKICRTAKFGH